MWKETLLNKVLAGGSIMIIEKPKCYNDQWEKELEIEYSLIARWITQLPTRIKSQ